MVRVNISKLMKYPSRASKDVAAINVCDHDDIKFCVERVMILNEEVNIDELHVENLVHFHWSNPL